MKHERWNVLNAGQPLNIALTTVGLYFSFNCYTVMSSLIAHHFSQEFNGEGAFDWRLKSLYYCWSIDTTSSCCPMVMNNFLAAVEATSSLKSSRKKDPHSSWIYLVSCRNKAVRNHLLLLENEYLLLHEISPNASLVVWWFRSLCFCISNQSINHQSANQSTAMRLLS